MRKTIAALLLACTPIGCGRAADEPERSDVVLVVVDTLRADHVLSRELRPEIPAIESIARDGVVFGRAFAHAPLTLPSHASLFSSRLPVQTGVIENDELVPEDVPLLAEWLRDHGYATVAVVSLGTLGHHGRKEAIHRGFDSYDDDVFHIARAEDVIERLLPLLDDLERKRPFFLFAHFSDPHTPYHAHGRAEGEAEVFLDGELLEVVSTTDPVVLRPDLDLAPGEHVVEVRGERFSIRTARVWQGGESQPVRWEEGEPNRVTSRARLSFEVPKGWWKRTRLSLWVTDAPSQEEVRARYPLELAHADRHIGVLLDELRRRGLYDDALVVFTSDHGEALGERGRIGHPGPLYDELLHVPLVIKPPRDSPRLHELRARRDRLVPLVDVAPTILHLAGVAALPGQRGRSLFEDGPRVLAAVTDGAKWSQACLRDDRYKMLYDARQDRFEMYDIVLDPGERGDVFAERSHERPSWPDDLRALSEGASQRRAGAQNRQLQESLDALGY